MGLDHSSHDYPSSSSPKHQRRHPPSVIRMSPRRSVGDLGYKGARQKNGSRGSMFIMSPILTIQTFSPSSYKACSSTVRPAGEHALPKIAPQRGNVPQKGLSNSLVCLFLQKGWRNHLRDRTLRSSPGHMTHRPRPIRDNLFLKKESQTDDLSCVLTMR